MMDDNEQLSESSAPAECCSSASTSPDGEQSQQIDVDNRPVGRCYVELMRARVAVDKLRAAQAELQEASAAVWVCRDAAKVSANTAGAALQRDSVAAACELIGLHINFIEKMIEDGTQAKQETG